MKGNLWESEHIRLRGIEPSDWQAFWDWNLDSETARNLYSVPPPQSREAVKQWAQKLSTQEAADDTFFFVIETLAGEMVGSINTHACDPRNGTFSYGVSILKDHRGKGYASEAITLILRYYFEELRYQKATVHTYSFNETSLRLHESLGFQLEGRVRRMIYTEGQYFDDLILGLTVEEFKARADL
ncbi:MAG TPA: GNAT family N-acetyltransferase [Chloroflexia bacterium]|jgi:RimJ/RimL family protein N-acetyltransferase